MNRAAMTNSRSLRANTIPRTILAICIQLVMSITNTIRMKIPASGPNALR